METENLDYLLLESLCKKYKYSRSEGARQLAEIVKQIIEKEE